MLAYALVLHAGSGCSGRLVSQLTGLTSLHKNDSVICKLHMP